MTLNLAIITGGSKGLGKALVELYRAKGWTVKEFSRSGVGSESIQCDFADAVSSEAVMDKAFAELAQQPWSRVVLINNAGTLNPIGPVELSNPNDWRSNIQINLNSAIMATGLFLKHFESSKAIKQVANISSGAATQAIYGWSLYCAAKAGLKAFVECVALEQAEKSDPVSVFSLRPGVIDTPMQQHIREQGADTFIDVERFKEFKEGGALRTPESVAQWVYERIEARPEGGEMLNITDWD